MKPKKLGWLVLLPIALVFSITSCDMLIDGLLGGENSQTTAVSIAVSIPASKAALGTIDEVTSVTVDVKQGGTVLVDGKALSESGGVYSATISGLPTGVVLTIIGHAYNATSSEIFTASTTKTLTGSGDTVDLLLTPIDDGTAVGLPRITRIALPTQIARSTSVTITVDVSGNVGEVLGYDFAPAAGGGSFTLKTGSVSIGSAGTATISTTYTAPFATGTFTHAVKVTNSQGNAVASSFDTNVVYTLVTTSAAMTVLFNPVILELHGKRSGSSVVWTAIVDDDRPLSELTYAWKLDGYSFSTSNPATMTGYSASTSGLVTLTVTDDSGLGGSTTLSYNLPSNQFPDSVVVDATTGSGVALFVDTSYVDYGTSYSNEASNLEATLESLGHSVVTFTGTTATDISVAVAGKAVLAVPEQEYGNLYTALDSAAQSAIEDFVNSGGRLLLFYDYYGYYLQLLNGTFGFSVNDTYDTEPYYHDATAAAGTPFASASAPASLPYNDDTQPLVSTTLPVGSKAIYTSSYGDSAVTYIPYGSGSIVILGWDWYDAAPTGSLDSGWLTVLDLAIP